jgi:hypothetical protein
MIRLARVLSEIFKLGFIPPKEEFYELTLEQYRNYYKTSKEVYKGEKNLHTITRQRAMV